MTDEVRKLYINYTQYYIHCMSVIQVYPIMFQIYSYFKTLVLYKHR